MGNMYQCVQFSVKRADAVFVVGCALADLRILQHTNDGGRLYKRKDSSHSTVGLMLFAIYILLLAPAAPCPFGIFLSVPNASKSFFL